MRKSNIYKKALEFTLKWEAGLTEDGKTNKGITQETYDHYRKTKYLDKKYVSQITQEEVDEIYFNIWIDSGCPYLPGLLAIVHFDSTVQFGQRDAIKILQRSMNLNPNGIMDMMTIGKANSYENTKALAYNYCYHRQLKRKAVVLSKPHLFKYQQGWNNRDQALIKYVTRDLSEDLDV